MNMQAQTGQPAEPSVEMKKDTAQENIAAMRLKYERELARERAAREEAERRALEVSKKSKDEEEDSDESEPYVDHKRLDKKFSSFERRMEEKIDKKAEEKARFLLEQERKNSWLRQNSDFYDVLQHAEKLALKDPDLAESILEMPDGFERQKLVYKNIKALGLHKPESKQPSIQEKIDANRKSPYYQPSGIGTAPYSGSSDYSESGQKNSYQKMQELKNRLRLG